MVEEAFLGQDLNLGFVVDEKGRVFAGPYSLVDLQPKLCEDISPRTVDLDLVSGRANLVQSVILRLKTEQGELAGLGHPKYGSRHHRLIGEPNTETNRNLIKLYVLECLRGEPRLEEGIVIDIRQAEGRETRDKVIIEITAKIKGIADPLNLVVPFSFEGPLA